MKVYLLTNYTLSFSLIPASLLLPPLSPSSPNAPPPLSQGTTWLTAVQVKTAVWWWLRERCFVTLHWTDSSTCAFEPCLYHKSISQCLHVLCYTVLHIITSCWFHVDSCISYFCDISRKIMTAPVNLLCCKITIIICESDVSIRYLG